jgi:hypothetical protein
MDKLAYCSICGELFEKKKHNQKRCSEECQQIQIILRANKKYKPEGKEYNCKCPKCGVMHYKENKGYHSYCDNCKQVVGNTYYEPQGVVG